MKQEQNVRINAQDNTLVAVVAVFIFGLIVVLLIMSQNNNNVPTPAPPAVVQARILSNFVCKRPTHTEDPTDTPTSTDEPSHTPTPTPTPTDEPTPTDTLTNTPTATHTEDPTDTPTSTNEPSHTPTPTPMPTDEPTPTDTPTNTPTVTHTFIPEGECLLHLSYIGNSEFLGGQAVARHMLADREITGVLCPIQEVGHTGLEARCNGVESVMAEEGIEVVRFTINYNVPESAGVIGVAFAANEGFNAIVTLGPDSAHSYYLYAEENDVTSADIIHATFGTSPTIFENIQEGLTILCIDQQP